MNPLYPKTYFRNAELHSESATAFVLMPFADEFLMVFDNVKDALAKLTPSVIATRADDLGAGGAIIGDILAGIARADVIIADLTGKNANVFYELGICHVMKNDVILLSQQAQDLPFDLRHLRCISYENTPSGLQTLSSRLRTSFREVLESRKRHDECERLMRLARSVAIRVSDWFVAWLGVLKHIAEWPEFKRNRGADHDAVIRKAASVLWEFGGGAYTLDTNGEILSSFPLDIRGQKYAHRDYFQFCSTRRAGVISNSFDSANRPHAIIVVAVPRLDDNGVYLGILDAVIDIDDSPLNRMIAPTALDPSDGLAQLILVDERRVVVGAYPPALVGRSVGGNPLVQRLFETKLSEGAVFLGDQDLTAAAVAVENTPFVLVAVGGQLTC